MNIPEMLHQVAQLAGAEWAREGGLCSITIRLPAGRRQRIYGTTTTIRGERCGLLYTHVGDLNEGVDARDLLAINASLRHARIALFEHGSIVVLALFNLEDTSVRECAPMLQEIGAVADELESMYFSVDRM